jgi:3-methyl-2-oxobutanoate hydroxymethyltransferase
MAFSPLQVLTDAKMRGERIAMVSLYDAPTAEICSEAGVDCLLVGDSMGNAMLGYDDFLSVTMDDVLRHTAAVARGVKQSRRPEVPVVADLPFGSYASPEQAAHNGAKLIRAGAHGVKLEGAGPSALAAIRTLVEMGAPIVGHLGFKPQSSLQFSSVVQGKTAGAASRLLQEARDLESAGCIALVLEAVTSEVASHITEELSIPTIGIGAGAGCVGQVLVWHDLAGLTTPRKKPFRFVKRYADSRGLFSEAARSFADEVRSGAFPTEEHGWNMPETELEEWRAHENGR